MGKLRGYVRKYMKYLVGYGILAPYYLLCCKKPVKKGLVILADGHANGRDYSFQALEEALRQIPDIQVIEYYHDYSFCSLRESLRVMLSFIKLYAQAQIVFICDSYIPISFCHKRKGTTVVQLWHSGGLMKKVGADSPDDALSMVKNQYRRLDVFTASSDLVSRVLSQALDIPLHKFSKAGCTRLDLLYREERIHSLRSAFFRNYPQYEGKKIILWAPTFRGNVQNAYLVGQEEILRLQKELGDDYAVLIRVHRFSGMPELNTPLSPLNFSAMQLLPIADMLITDYSSIYYDYLYFRKPVVLFAPDLESYKKNRGLYLDYQQVPGRVAQDYTELKRAVETTDVWADSDYYRQMDAFWQEQMGYCDGHSCEKLLRELELL